MKKFLAIAAMLAMNSVFAEEIHYGDLNYFLKQGQFNVGVDTIINNEGTRTNESDKTEVDNYFVDSRFAFALSDSLNFTLGLNYLHDGQTEVNQGSSADDAGLQNPKLGANFRLLKQSDAFFNLDIGAVATIQVIDREVGTVNKEGNNLNPLFSNYAEPRNTLDLNARLGKKWDEANEFYLTGGIAYHMDGEYEELEGEMVDMDSSIDLKVAAFYQYRPVDEFMMTLGLNGTRYSEVKGENGSTDFTITDHIDYQFVFNAKYLINESLIAKFVFTQDSRNDFDFETDAGNTTFDKRNGLQYGIGVDLLF